jgi:hypothetical protein
MKHLLNYTLFEKLTYDEMDLTPFDNRYIVGRWFANEEDAMEYLKKSITDYKNIKFGGEVSAEDYFVNKEEGDTSLKPYRLYRKPTEMESRRKEADDFLNKNAIRTGQTMFTGGVWAHSFVEYKHIDELKRLGINYRFRPIKEINLDPVLQKELKPVFGSVLIQQGRLKFFSLDYSFDKDYIKDLKARVEEELSKFNKKLGTDYFVEKTYTKESTDTQLARARRLLNDDDRPVNVMYDVVEFGLQRGHDEEEFLAIIPEGEKGMPSMFVK